MTASLEEAAWHQAEEDAMKAFDGLEVLQTKHGLADEAAAAKTEEEEQVNAAHEAMKVKAIKAVHDAELILLSPLRNALSHPLPDVQLNQSIVNLREEQKALKEAISLTHSTTTMRAQLPQPLTADVSARPLPRPPAARPAPAASGVTGMVLSQHHSHPSLLTTSRCPSNGPA